MTPEVPDVEPDRWSLGMSHHPRSMKLMEFIAAMDLKHYSDGFCWKTGGDGDNGETLMYEMDSYFEQLSQEGLKCRTCGEVMSEDCPRCKRLWES